MRALYDVAAPAKLNLFLHVTGRRSDGYHLLESVFTLIDWCDTLHFERRTDAQISRQDLGPALPADDLIVRAARALQRACAPSAGVHIAVEKRVPSQAGLGGGSSDAASTLIALNRLWGCQLDLAQLSALGVQLGADVPFFLFGQSAWVSGIGEQLQPVDVPQTDFWVLKPDAGVATPQIFLHPDLQRASCAATMRGFAADPFGYGHNDLQPVAQSLCPPISQALAWLADQGLTGRMTGSGSAVFARAWAAALPAPPLGVEMRRCQGGLIHPLQGWVGRSV